MRSPYVPTNRVYSQYIYIICRTDNATRDQDYIGLEEQLEFSVETLKGTETVFV